MGNTDFDKKVPRSSPPASSKSASDQSDREEYRDEHSLPGMNQAGKGPETDEEENCDDKRSRPLPQNAARK
jgi:hypothetical protein